MHTSDTPEISISADALKLIVKKGGNATICLEWRPAVDG